MAMDPHPTKLEYYDNMWKLQSHSTFLSYFQVFSSLSDIHYKFLGILTSNYLRVNLRFDFLWKGEDGRLVMVLDSTIFHPQGGGQPFDTGVITLSTDHDFKFAVNDVRSKDGIVSYFN